MFRFKLFPSLLISVAFASIVTTNAQNVSTFREYIAKDPDLSALSDAIIDSGFNVSGRYGATVFAPTNQAFTSLDITLLAKLLKPGWSQHLANLLLMHISGVATVNSSNLMDGDEILAKNWENLTISIESGNILVSSPNTNNSLVLEADMWVVEGVVHKVDQVLLPQFVNTNLLSVVEIKGFTVLTELLELTGLKKAVATGKIATVFAPTDEAFAALGEKSLAYYRANVDSAFKLLAGHMIPSVVLPTREMVNGQIAHETAGGTYLTVTIEDYEGNKHFMIDDVIISSKDLLANNGIIHGIDAVLAVPGTEYPSVSYTTSYAIAKGYVAPFMMMLLTVFVIA